MGNEMPQDPNHIWLRQSVTFTVNGETRTIELALPLRPGATPGEVEALLDEADAGMRRLSRRLDAHLAALRQPVDAEASEVEAPAISLPPPPIPAAVSVPHEHATAPDLTIPSFLAEITAMGYTQRQAMDKLNVRSLNGLNLRESLESLRRQALLGDQNGAAPASAPATPPPLAFEEEDGEEGAGAAEPEMELSYPDPVSLPDEPDEEDEEQAAPTAPTLDALRRDARLTQAAKLPAPPRRASSPATPATPAAEPAAPEPETEETPAVRAARILAELRALPSGGTPSAHQRAAFANIVTSELTERGVAALAKDIWNITPNELGTEQLDALISWGKRDHFKDEARETLKAARAAGPPPPAPPAPPDEPADEEQEEPETEPPPPPTRGGRGGRARPSGGAAEGPRGEP